MMSRGGGADSLIVPPSSDWVSRRDEIGQGSKGQVSQMLSLHSFEHSPLPPASPTTRVTRVTFLSPQRQSSSSLDSTTLQTALLSSAPILLSSQLSCRSESSNKSL